MNTFSSKNIWFTSDTHFCHSNIIKYCNRPFKNVEEMNQTLVNNWNSEIPKNGIVFHLGDFGLGKIESILEIAYQLNGEIYIAKGNHDKQIWDDQIKSRFKKIEDYYNIEVDSQSIILGHFAFREWNKKHYGSWNLFGHSHGRLDPMLNTLDVGVDCNNFKPISFEEVKRKINVIKNNQ